MKRHRKKGQVYLRKGNDDSPAVGDGKLRIRVQIGSGRYLDLKAYFLELVKNWQLNRE